MFLSYLNTYSDTVKLKASSLNQSKIVSKIACPDFQLSVGDSCGSRQSYLLGYRTGNEIFINDIFNKSPQIADSVGLYLTGFPAELEGVKVDVQIKSTNSSLSSISDNIFNFSGDFYVVDENGTLYEDNSYLITIKDFLFHHSTQVTDEYNGTYDLTVSFLGVTRNLTLHIEL